MAVRKSRKIEAQVVTAIRRLQSVQGSTPREISNYIAQEYNVPVSEVRGHVQLALKRGVIYGILQRWKGGCYTYNPNLSSELTLNSGDAGVEICKRRRPRGRKRSGCRRKRSGRSRRRRRRSGCRSRRRRKSKRRRSSRRCGRRRRRKRAVFPGDIDGFESIPLSQPTKSKSLIEQERPPSNHSTISGNSEEKQE